MGVASSSQLGSKERVRENFSKLVSVLREVEAGHQQALQEARSQQALDRRVHDAEARSQDLQIQLKASQDAYQESRQSLQESRQSLQESQQSLQESQQSLQQSQQSLQESQQSLQESRQFHLESQQSLQASQAEKRFLDGALEESQAEKTALQEMLVSAEQSVQEAEDQVRHLQQSVDEASARTEALQRRVEVAEHRAREAERRARDARQGESEGEPSWVVQRDEINLTDTEVGRGGWAVVRVAEFRGARFAAKCLYRQIVSNYNRLLFTREMNMASRVRHPNLLQFIGATLRGELIILTELMPTSVRGELANERTFSENQINSISLDVARALNYLHLMQPSPIIHRDISSANVLLEPGPSNSWRAKVSDYGSVNLLGRLRTITPGNPTYAAPEAENTALQSPKMDIFSFGVLLVEMCSAQFPEVADREHLICSIQHPDMVALIRRCLAEDRTARPSASDLITELNEHSA